MDAGVEWVQEPGSGPRRRGTHANADRSSGRWIPARSQTHRRRRRVPLKTATNQESAPSTAGNAPTICHQGAPGSYRAMRNPDPTRTAYSPANKRVTRTPLVHRLRARLNPRRNLLRPPSALHGIGSMLGSTRLLTFPRNASKVSWLR